MFRGIWWTITVPSAQLLPCTSLSTFSGCLTKIRPESNVLIISCLSNFIRDSQSSSEATTRITEALEAVRGHLFPYCEANPDLYVMICPPQFSRSPVWYSESLSLSHQLLKSVVMDMSELDSLFLLPSCSSEVQSAFCLGLMRLLLSRFYV